MERSSSQNSPIAPPPPVCGAASPSSGGEFLLQLLQQGRPSSTFPSSCSRNNLNSFGDGSAIHSRHHSSSSSSGADWGGSSSFSRASSTEACVFEEARAHLLSRTSSLEASVLDEEQALFQLQHDPAVAAMGPSHPVGAVNSVANSFGNMNGEERGISPFHDHYAQHPPHQQHHHHHHHHHQHQHLGLQQVPAPPPYPRPPPSEHLLTFPLDPLSPSMHTQFLRPYPPYPRLPPLVDHNMYLRVPPPTFSHTGLLNSNRLPDSVSNLSYPVGERDQLKLFSNEGLTNGQNTAPLRMLISVSRRTPNYASSSPTEEASAPSNSKFYTQFGSIGVDVSHENSSKGKTSHAGLPDAVVFQQPSSMNKQVGVLPSPLLPKRVVAQSLTSVESLHGDRQQYPSTVEASPEARTQKRESEQAGPEGSFHVFQEGVEEKLERCAIPVADSANTTQSIQKASHGIIGVRVSEGIASIAAFGIIPENDCETKIRLNKPQKGLDSSRKVSTRNALGHWVPIVKEKREDFSINRMESAVPSEDARTDIIEEGQKRKGLLEGWRPKQFCLSSDLLGIEPVDSPKGLNQSTKAKVPLQQDPLGLPSGSKVDSAPSSATEQSKQALQVMPATNAADIRSGERSEDAVKAAVESNQERIGETAGTLISALSLLDFDKNEMEEKASSKSKRSFSEDTNMVARPVRSVRREPSHRLDVGKCTIKFLAIFQTLIPLIDEEQRRKQLLESLDELVSGIWPEARLYLFGSCANAFGVCNSDIDVCLSIDGESATRSEVVCALADALKANHMQNVQALTHARVPIVKYSDPKTGISCDVCVNNMLAVVNTKLLHDYAQIDVRLRQLAFMVKHWAKCRQVNETYRGTLSSYAYVLCESLLRFVCSYC
ncbi:hypothetical protein L7F22_017781 [Adiantum nelumboides]|nr:hypothetical protein [Adiantum nelumboides]